MPKLTIVHLLLMSVFSLIISSLNPAIADSKLSVTQHWFEDKTKILNPDQALEHFTAGKGKAIQNKVFKLGNEATHIWVLLKLKNQTTEAQSLRLLAGVPYSKLLEARQINLDKSTQHPVFTPLI